MRSEDGTWLQTPPNSPAISTPDSVHNIDEFISMDPKIGVGTVYNLQEFVRRFFRTQ